MDTTPKAYFLTWTTYGTWLPGDSRGWVHRHRIHGDVVEAPDPKREAKAKDAMQDGAVALDDELRAMVERSLRNTSAYCGWCVHALQVRSNHVHIVVTALDTSPGETMRVLKAYATRMLNRRRPGRRGRWWTRQGSKRRLFTNEALAAAIRYVQNQDTAWQKE